MWTGHKFEVRLCHSSLLCRLPTVKLNVLQLTVFLQVQNCPSPKNPAAHEQLYEPGVF